MGGHSATILAGWRPTEQPTSLQRTPIATIVDIEELIDNVLALQHPKMRERCFIDRNQGCGRVHVSMSAQKKFARLRRALFSYVSQTACLDS